MANVTGNQLGGTAKRIHEQIVKKPGSGSESVAVALGLSQRTVRNLLAMMVNEKLLRGDRASGFRYWATEKLFPEITSKPRRKAPEDTWPYGDEVISSAMHAMCSMARSV